MSNPRFEDENMFKLSGPDIDKIKCADCQFRAKDRFNGSIKGATLGLCAVYEDKPSEILWDGKDCPYHTVGSPDWQDEQKK